MLFVSCDLNQNIGETGTSLGAVDMDGDGASDGTAIDIDGDGEAVGVDTDGDGAIDEAWSDDYTIIASPADTTAPEDVSIVKLSRVGYCDDSSSEFYGSIIAEISWNDPSDRDLSKVTIEYDGSTEEVAKGLGSKIISFQPTGTWSDTLYTVTLKTVDTSGNISSGVEQLVYATRNDESTPIYVSDYSADNLHTILNNNKDGYIILDTDIDLDGYSWTTIEDFIDVLRWKWAYHIEL